MKSKKKWYLKPENVILKVRRGKSKTCSGVWERETKGYDGLWERTNQIKLTKYNSLWKMPGKLSVSQNQREHPITRIKKSM
jgi:hypothetical protein